MFYLLLFLLVSVTQSRCEIENKLTKHNLIIGDDQRIWLNDCLLTTDTISMQPFKLDQSRKIVFKESCKACDCIKIIQYDDSNSKTNIFFVNPKKSVSFSSGSPISIRILKVIKI